MLLGLPWADDATGSSRRSAAAPGEAGPRGVGRRWEAQEDDVSYCRRRIAEEEAEAAEAGSPEAGLVHSQVAMLYKVQLATLQRRAVDPEAT